MVVIDDLLLVVKRLIIFGVTFSFGFVSHMQVMKDYSWYGTISEQKYVVGASQSRRE